MMGHTPFDNLPDEYEINIILMLGFCAEIGIDAR